MSSHRFASRGEVSAVRRRPETAVSGIHVENTISCWIPDTAACASKAQASPIHFSIKKLVRASRSPKHKRKEWQNRRASGTSAGEKTDSDVCLHPESSGFSPATGYQQIACRSASKKRNRSSASAIASSCGRSGGWPWCLGGCDVGGRALCPLWLCASVVQNGASRVQKVGAGFRSASEDRARELHLFAVSRMR